MASAEGPARVHDRHGRRRPFASWMKRLANLKSSHAESGPNNMAQKRLNIPMTPKSKKSVISKNNPYPVSCIPNGHRPHSPSLGSPQSRHSSLSQSKQSFAASHDGQPQPKSRAPTLATTAETAISDAGLSGAGTSATAAKTDGDHNSTFSSPAPSLRSMTTTLTTVQSTAPPTATQNTNTNLNPNPNGIIPAPSIPAHLAPHAHPTTYHSATANNVLTDDASILTLASSSKRRRRNSVDTNASIRALAPASMFGGSRESLPLSVLSGTVIHGQATDTASLRDANGTIHPRPATLSGSGVTAPALASERNSYIGATTVTAKYSDAASIRSGLLGAHGRNGSLSGSIGGLRERDVMVTAPTSPLVSDGGMTSYMPLLAEKETQHAEKERGKLSRRNSAWSRIPDDDESNNHVHDDEREYEHNGKQDL